MCFHIAATQWHLNAFRLTVADAIVEAKSPAYSRTLISAFSERKWKWIDGTEYSLLTRAINRGANPSSKITSGGKTLGEASLHIPFRGPMRIEWKINDDALLVYPGCCRGKLLRATDRRRLAVWHQRLSLGSGPKVDGVWRSDLPGSLRPLLFGMILDAIISNNDV